MIGSEKKKLFERGNKKTVTPKRTHEKISSSRLSPLSDLERRYRNENPRVCCYVVEVQFSDDLVLGHVRLQIDFVGENQQRSRRQLLVFE